MVQKNQEITFKKKKFRKDTKQEMGQGFYFPGKLRKQKQTLGGQDWEKKKNKQVIQYGKARKKIWVHVLQFLIMFSLFEIAKLLL